MLTNLLKFYVSLLFVLTPLKALAEDEQHIVSRRSFLGGLLATAGAAAAAPVIPINGTPSALTEAAKLQLAKLRLSSLDTIDSGLEVYIDKLTQIMKSTDSQRLKEFLSMRIEKAERALAVYKDIQLNSTGEVTTDHSTSVSQADPSVQAEKERLKQLHKKNQERVQNLGDLESIDPDVRLLMIRGLLDVDVMNRMAAQNAYGIENTILSNPDVSLLTEYKRLIEATIASAPASSLVLILAPQLLAEVEVVLENSPLWHRRHQAKGKALSCGKFI